MQDILWFLEVNKDDVRLVGGKGANLGELYRNNIPVPNGFIVTAQAYLQSLKESGTMDHLKGILFGLDVENPTLLADKAKLCQEEIQKIKLHENLVKKIEDCYKKLSEGKEAYVAVRSSATAEDLPEASFAGQQATFLNIKGKENLKKAILSAWASLFEARAIFYRTQQKFDHFKVGIAVPVQKMIQSEVSGVMFTLDPITNNKSTITIEAIFGLGELIVGGQITPDHYEVSKENLAINKKAIVKQSTQLVRTGNGNKLIKVSKAFAKAQKLPDEKIVELAALGKKIEKHYFFPQDIEWALEDNKLYIVQTRPVTTTAKIITEPEKEQVKSTAKVILQGAPASPVIGSGKVVIIHSPKELDKVKSGDVLVTEMTNPDFVPAMKRAAAIVTDRGGRTSHAAIVSRELGIPCVVGTEKATKILKDGMIITVDGAKGIIYLGTLAVKKDLESKSASLQKIHKTATHVYVNQAEPRLAPQIAAKNVDGVGLLRAEFILAQIGKHPKEFIRENKQKEFVEKLAEGLNIFGKSFGERPVIYRASDLKSNEYRNLTGGDKYEPVEPNPMLGYRGAFRYIKDPDAFKLELEAIKIVRKNHKNIHLMIPFVRNTQELTSVREIAYEVGLFDDKSFKFWMMVEIPTNVILLDEFIDVGIDGISIGSNDLTMLLLGTDRDNEEVSNEYQELDQAVLWALEKAIRIATKRGITVSICGQAPSVYPELTKKLVSWGITSISVNPDAIDITRQYIYEAEKALLKK